MKPHQDPNHELNGPKYYSKRKCAIKGCKSQSGTAWSEYFCFQHNKERMDRISSVLEKVVYGEFEMVVDNDDSGTMKCPNGHEFKFDVHTEEGTWHDGRVLKPCCTVCGVKK